MILGPQNLADLAAEIGPTYHDFSWLGLKTVQHEGIYRPNQIAKAPVICAYILAAMAELRCRSIPDITFAELFCADAFYAMFAARFGARHATGFDDDRDGYFAKALKIQRLLGIENVTLRATRIESIPVAARFDVVANIGGLYHVDDPLECLERSYAMARHFLIVQNVVSMAVDDPDYFAAPAPGWTWGNRFSKTSFDRQIKLRGWRVIDSSFNLLEGNSRPEDRGSVYYLIAKENGPLE